MTEYGSGGSFTVTMDGPFSGGSGGGEAEKLTKIRALAESWKGGTSPYTQVVAVDGISVSSKVEIHMSAEDLDKLSNQRITFTVENKGGTVTIFAIGDKPNTDCEFQVTLSNILNVTGEAIDAIRGNTISTNNPQSDYEQDNAAEASFIKNKPVLLDMDVFSMTLYASQWSGNRQTVESSRVLSEDSNQAIISVADPGSLETYLDCNVRMESQRTGAITYACDDVPTSDIGVNIMILTQGG